MINSAARTLSVEFNFEKRGEDPAAGNIVSIELERALITQPRRPLSLITENFHTA